MDFSPFKFLYQYPLCTSLFPHTPRLCRQPSCYHSKNIWWYVENIKNILWYVENIKNIWWYVENIKNIRWYVENIKNIWWYVENIKNIWWYVENIKNIWWYVENIKFFIMIFPPDSNFLVPVRYLVERNWIGMSMSCSLYERKSARNVWTATDRI
jgi:hypothetical protein